MFDLTAFFAGADKVYAENNIEKIESYLLDSFSAAESSGDQSGMLAVANELIGCYRVKSEYGLCVRYAQTALSLIESLHLEQTEEHGTTLLNIATAYRAAGRLREARQMYDRVLSIYRLLLPPKDVRIAGLYNNLSLLSQEMGDSETALAQAKTAYRLIRDNEQAPAEKATVLNNLGLMQLKRKQYDAARASILQSIDLFENSVPYHDPHYAASLAAAAQLCFISHDFDRSVRYYEKAMEQIKSAYGENDDYRLTRHNLELVREYQRKEEAK